MLAPIALFVYNRADHVAQTVASLQRNALALESELIIFSDASKNSSTRGEVRKVKEYIKTIQGFKSVKIIERAENFGLAKSIIQGVTDIVNQYGKIIVLEDDLVTSPYFLKYMNKALDLYEHDESVVSIHGYIYPVKEKLPETFFLRGADCWGWATWKRGWDIFEPDGQKLLKELKKKRLTQEFDFDGSYPYTRMLESQILGLNHSWAIRWYAAAFLKEKLTLYPGRSLINNIGLDASGVHCADTDEYNVALATEPIKLEKQEFIEDAKSKEIIINYFRSLRVNTIVLKLKFFIKKLLLCLKR